MRIHPVDTFTRLVNSNSIAALQGFPTDVDGRSHAIIAAAGRLSLWHEFNDYVLCLNDNGGRCAICSWGGKLPAERE